jgi:rhodanese-related sulfurtransferase
MKRRAALALAVAPLLVVTACSSGTDASAVESVNAQQGAAIVQQDGVTIIDVRTPAEFAAGHVEGAVNIDVQAATFDSRIAELDKNGTYFVYCRSGNRSATATQRMADAGFTDLTTLDGGLADLGAAGVTVVT